MHATRDTNRFTKPEGAGGHVMRGVMLLPPMRTLAFWLPVVISLAAAPICLYLGVASGGAGHGDYFLATILFPFTILSTVLFGSITLPFILLAAAQYPAYGILLGLASMRGRFQRAASALLVVHASAVTACLIFIGENFS